MEIIVRNNSIIEMNKLSIKKKLIYQKLSNYHYKTWTNDDELFLILAIY